MKNASFLIVGGDKRQTYCAHILKEKGHDISTFLVPEFPSQNLSLEALKKAVSASKYILCPTPFSKDSLNINTTLEYSDIHLPADLLMPLLNENHTLIGGAIPKNITDILTKKEISYYDLMHFKSLTYANACLTAEGLLKYIIESIPFSIAGSNVLILGFGRCGSAIARTLNLLGANLTIYNRNKYYECKAKALGFKTRKVLSADTSLSKHEIIINTIPDIIYTKEHLSHTDKSAYLFEVASAPGGFDMDYITSNKMFYKNCPGIPGKTSPKTAARIICDVITEEIG